MLLGLTGGVATGKSTVARMLEERGAVVVSADEASREVTHPGSPTLERIMAEFGREYALPDGSLDRRRLGKRIFADPEARRRLEEITHPAILDWMRKRIADLRAGLPPGSVIVVEAPLLFEAGMEDWFDRILVVTASEATQTKRLRERDGLTDEEARRRIAAQMPLSEKAARADDILENDDDLAALRSRVEEVWSSIRGKQVDSDPSRRQNRRGGGPGTLAEGFASD